MSSQKIYSIIDLLQNPLEDMNDKIFQMEIDPRKYEAADDKIKYLQIKVKLIDDLIGSLLEEDDKKIEERS